MTSMTTDRRKARAGGRYHLRPSADVFLMRSHSTPILAIFAAWPLCARNKWAHRLLRYCGIDLPDDAAHSTAIRPASTPAAAR
jgi:hypothetical protein